MLSAHRWYLGPISQFLGVATEYYDLTIIAVLLPILTKVFLPPEMPSIIASFYVVAGVGISFFTRPIGSMIFGHYSDRIGRRGLMIVSMSGMAIVTAFVAILPSYAQAGFFGLALLLLVRVFVGIFYGGEYTAGFSFGQEWTPAKWRGVTSGLAVAGSGVGGLFGTSVTASFVAYYGTQAMVSYAWRYCFLFGIVTLIPVVLLRMRVLESPIFEAARSTGKIEKSPLASLLKEGTRFRFIQSTLVTVGFLLAASVATSYIAPLLTNSPSRLDMSQYLGAYSFFLIGQIVASMVIGGPVSQYLGRRRWLLIWAAVVMILTIPTTYGIVMLGSIPNLFGTMFLAGLLGVLEQVPISVFPAYLTERFGTTHRASGSGLAYSLGSTIGGLGVLAFVPLLHSALAAVETSTNVWLTVGCVIIAGAVLGFIGAYIGPETVRTKLEEVESKA
jgi:MFS family permease